jgi:hypothetical protein
MAWFQCLIHGENFPGAFISARHAVGFYACRVVEARSAEEAESKALALLKDEPRLRQPASRFSKRRARVYFEDVFEIPEDHEQVKSPPSAFIWHEMSSHPKWRIWKRKGR